MTYWAILGTVFIVNVITFQNADLKKRIQALRDDQVLLNERIVGLQAEIRAKPTKWCRWW